MPADLTDLKSELIELLSAVQRYEEGKDTWEHVLEESHDVFVLVIRATGSTDDLKPSALRALVTDRLLKSEKHGLSSMWLTTQFAELTWKVYGLEHGMAVQLDPGYVVIGLENFDEDEVPEEIRESLLQPITASRLWESDE